MFSILYIYIYVYIGVYLFLDRWLFSYPVIIGLEENLKFVEEANELKI